MDRSQHRGQSHQCSAQNGCRGKISYKIQQQQANLNPFSQLQPFSPSRQRSEAVSVWLAFSVPWPTVWDARDMHHGNMKVQYAAFPQHRVLNYRTRFPHLHHIFCVVQTHRPSLLPFTLHYLQQCPSAPAEEFNKWKNLWHMLYYRYTSHNGGCGEKMERRWMKFFEHRLAGRTLFLHIFLSCHFKDDALSGICLTLL